MGHRRFEMFHYRQIIERLRASETEREISRTRFMGREKVAKIRVMAKAFGWLDPTQPLPDDELIAAQFSKGKQTNPFTLPGITAPTQAHSTITNSSHYSSVEPWRHLVDLWAGQGVNGVAIHAALARDHGYKGSYSSVYRMMLTLRAAIQPDITVRLHFDPADAAQVDFGAGPHMIHPDGQKRRTWAFVMTLAFSRHQYVEFVWDQTVATWLGCHRRGSSGLGALQSESLSTILNAPLLGPARPTPWCNAPMQNVRKVTALRSIHAHPVTRKKRASLRRALSTSRTTFYHFEPSET
jgi:hypothetical protein